MIRLRRQQHEPTPADALGLPFLAADAPWCGLSASISIRWDSWAVAEITCLHGTTKAVTDPINLQETLDRAIEAWLKAEHPNICTVYWRDGKGRLERCERWEGHDGDHGDGDDDD